MGSAALLLRQLVGSARQVVECPAGVWVSHLICIEHILVKVEDTKFQAIGYAKNVCVVLKPL